MSVTPESKPDRGGQSGRLIIPDSRRFTKHRAAPRFVCGSKDELVLSALLSLGSSYPSILKEVTPTDLRFTDLMA